MREYLGELYRQESRRVFATLVRLLGDFDLAEEAMQEAFAAAVEQWQLYGKPANPRAWLVSTGRFKAIDAMRRRAHSDELRDAIARRVDELSSVNAERAALDIEDDRLRLVFTCCHPALAPVAQIAMTLREVCDLTTEQIAAAFLTAPKTIAQRIVRAKLKIREAKIPYEVPTLAEFPERLGSVLSVIYLVFNEGYSPSSGDTLTKPDLSAEAIRLGRLVLELLPDPEVMGLLALMLLHDGTVHARRRRDPPGGPGSPAMEPEHDRRGQGVDRAFAAHGPVWCLHDSGCDLRGSCGGGNCITNRLGPDRSSL